MAEKKHRSKIWIWLLKPGRRYAKWLLLLLLGMLVATSYSGWMDVIRTHLDQPPFLIQFGDYKASLYALLKGLLIVVLLFWGAAAISGFGESRINRMKIRASNRILFTKLFQITLYIIAFLIGLDVVGIELTTLTVFGGALGIGIGFGLQKITSNFISGLILLYEKSIEQDDLIELNDGTYGFIRRTSARFTLVETFDGKEIMIPNEDFITNRVINWTYSNKRGRAEATISVAYGSDLEKVHMLILEAAREHPRCMKDPEPACYLMDFGDSAIIFLLHFWVADVVEGRMGPRSDIMFAIWHKFREHGIEIPFPQRDLHIKNPEALKQVMS